MQMRLPLPGVACQVFSLPFGRCAEACLHAVANAFDARSLGMGLASLMRLAVRLGLNSEASAYGCGNWLV
jgi:hypothetical protein